MKRVFCLVLCLFLLLPAARAENGARRLKEDDPLFIALRERALEMAGLFNEALHSESYLLLYQPADSFAEELSLLRMQDFTQPRDVAIVRADEPCRMDGQTRAALTAVLSRQEAASPALAEQLRRGVYASAGNLLLADSGAATIALASMLTLSDAFIKPEAMDGPCFALMQYGGLYAFLVTFYPNANGVVTAAARFIPSQAADRLNLPSE